jgi:uncharacterized membrane protein
MHYGFLGWHSIWMVVSWIVVIGLFAACIWLLGFFVNIGGEKSPEEILKQRYAAGEIDSDEFNRRLAELRRTKTAA